MSEYEIPKRYIAKLENISRKVGEPINNLKAEFGSRFVELKAQYKNRSNTALWKLAYQFIQQHWRPVGRALAWTGFFIGETEVRDWVEITKQIIDSMSDEEKEQYITASGEYLNPYEKSRNYLEPLPEHRYFKNMYGIIGEPGFKNPEFTVLEWNGELATKIPEHNFLTMYNFRATTRKSENYRRLGGVKATEFKPAEIQVVSKEQEKLIRTLCPFKPFNMLADYYNLIGKKKAAREVILTEAGIGFITKTKRGYIMRLEDTEDTWVEPITAFVPEFIPIDFGANSIVLILGTLFKDKQNRLNLNTLGVYVPEEYKLAPVVDTNEEEASLDIN